MDHKPRPANETGTAAPHDADAPFEVLLQSVGQERNRDAFIRLFHHFAPRLKSFLMKRGNTPEQAEEITQDTMLNVWNKAPTYDPARASASTWIFTIARNRHIDLMRKSARADFDATDPAMVADDAPAPDANIIARDQAEKIAGALQTLPPEQADMIRQSFFEDKTHQQIAMESGLPLGTVKSRLRLAMARLQTLLAGQEATAS